MGISSVAEYIRLLPKGITNAPAVVEGIRNSVRFNNGQLSEELQDAIIKRRLICAACPFNSEIAKTSDEFVALFGENYKTKRKELHCTFCACVIEYKTAVPSDSCGIAYYNRTNKSGVTLPLMWEAIK